MSKNVNVDVTIGSLDKELYFGPTFLRGLIYVISAAIFITIFELCFYVIHIVPLEHENVVLKIHGAKKWNIDNTLKSGGIDSINSIIDLLENLNFNKDVYGRSFIETMSDRELKLSHKNNNNAIFFIVLEIFIFILFIFLVYQKLITYVTSDKKLNIGYNTHYGAGILPPIINAFLTTLILIIFQLNMYFFAQKWLYTSDYEIDYEITKNLDKYLN